MTHLIPENMSKLFLNSLDSKRQRILFQLQTIFPKGILGGETAIALQINHRRSFDLDIFTSKPITPTLLRKVNEFWKTSQIEPLIDTDDELSILVDKKVKVSFIYFPFPALYPPIKSETLTLFHFKDLASNKAYAIGRRPVYRDYVDLYFLLHQKSISLSLVIKEAQKRFAGNFNVKLFLAQLTYFEDLTDFTIEFIREKTTLEEVKTYFTKEVKSYLKHF